MKVNKIRIMNGGHVINVKVERKQRRTDLIFREIKKHNKTPVTDECFTIVQNLIQNIMKTGISQ